MPTESKPVKIGVYLRTSSDFQEARHGTGAQRHAIEQWLKVHGGGPVEWFEDNAESGRKMARAAFQRLEQAIQARELGTVLVFSLSRLGRNTVGLLEFSRKMQEAGVRFVSLKEALDTSTPMGRFFYTILAAFAELESEVTGERVSAGIRAQIAAGKKWGAGHHQRFNDKVRERALAMRAEGKTWAEVGKALKFSGDYLRQRVG